MLAMPSHDIDGGTMSEHDNERSRESRPDGAPLQGEGDYQASRRYRERLGEFIEKADVDALAHDAAPASAQQARDLALAEERGRDRSKGDDAADAGLMYPRRTSESDR
jgi:hypothetical protein